MLRICYMSRATAPHDGACAHDLLSQSRASNERDGITGLLLFDGERFLQAIEGPAAATAACYGRIHTDARHHHIRLVSQEAIEQREFGDWSMTYRCTQETEAGAFLATVLEDVRHVRDDHLQMLFAGFAARCADRRPAATPAGLA